MIVLNLSNPELYTGIKHPEEDHTLFNTAVVAANVLKILDNDNSSNAILLEGTAPTWAVLSIIGVLTPIYKDIRYATGNVVTTLIHHN